MKERSDLLFQTKSKYRRPCRHEVYAPANLYVPTSMSAIARCMAFNAIRGSQGINTSVYVRWQGAHMLTKNANFTDTRQAGHLSISGRLPCSFRKQASEVV